MTVYCSLKGFPANECESSFFLRKKTFYNMEKFRERLFIREVYLLQYSTKVFRKNMDRLIFAEILSRFLIPFLILHHDTEWTLHQDNGK